MRSTRIISAALALIFTTSAHAEMYNSRPPEFRGGIAKQQSQHELARAYAIQVTPTDADIDAEIKAGRLVRLYDTMWYRLDEDLGRGYPARELLYHVRPWVAKWLETLSQKFYAIFGKRLKLTSLIRTIARHEQIEAREINAARGVPTAHLTGAAVDISKLGFTQRELRWMRHELAGMVAAKQIVVIEEMHVLNFHVLVLPAPPPKPEPEPTSVARANDYDCVRDRPWTSVARGD